METDLLPNVRGNVQALRNMWNDKTQQDQKSFKPRATVYRSGAQIPPRLAVEEEPMIKKKPTVTFDHIGKIDFWFISNDVVLLSSRTIGR